MKIETTLQDGLLALALTGQFDTFGAGPVQRELDAHFQQRPRAVLLDLSGVDFISSAGVRVLLITAKELEARGGVLALAGLRPFCRDLLRSIQAAAILPQFETAAQAAAFCREHAGT